MTIQHHPQEQPADTRTRTYNDASTAYTVVTARERYEALSEREMCARTVAGLRQRGEFDLDDLGHRVMAEHEPLTAADQLEMMAAGEVLARYYRHPAALDRAAKAGATWEQIGAARGTSADQARADYREWAIGQHALHKDMGRWGIGDEEYAAAMTRDGGDRARCVVRFDLTDDRDTDFVLTEALCEFAARQRSDAQDEEPGSLSAQDRIRWAESAEAALGRIENPAPLESEGLARARAYLDLMGRRGTGEPELATSHWLGPAGTCAGLGQSAAAADVEAGQ
jgi:hypothetical protein